MNDEEDLAAEGYAWGFARQERELPEEEYRAHMRLLDEVDEEELEGLDLKDADDYVLWAAAQAFEELERHEGAIAVLKRIAASTSPHPALDYPDILFRLEELLKDRGDYDEALPLLHRVEQIDSNLRERCDERRAEILILRGEPAEGLRLFEKTARAFPDDPWVPLRAAWALLTSGSYGEIPRLIDWCEKALKKVKHEEEARAAASEIDRLRRESEARRKRRARLDTEGAGPPAGLEAVKEDILAALDAEEARLTGNPPRDAMALSRATERLAGLLQRASRAWDDAVEAGDEEAIAAFDDLMAEIASLAERFGIELPGVDD